MAKLLIKIEKGDVKTSELGKNIIIQCENNIDLVFTPDAIKELISDFNHIKKTKRQQLSDETSYDLNKIRIRKQKKS